MAKVVNPISARVEVIGKPKPSAYQPNTFYYPTLFIDLSQPEGSEEAKIWKSLSGDEVSQIMQGDRVQLVPAGQDKNGKTKHNIVVTQPAQSQVSKDYEQRTIAPVQTSAISADTKRAIAAYIDGQADLYRFCYLTAHSKFDGLIEDQDSIRTIATTLYLGTVQKFGLAR
ncbi:MAG: hypothetical protein KME35_17935 [Aphanocapsa sp. GSE-SYN-MK-11-07L]|jgi:hypothetical protein|nr:hypothetical protein [Aphanocapsa sp. GSE-SYN-MK-11-07L]